MAETRQRTRARKEAPRELANPESERRRRRSMSESNAVDAAETDFADAMGRAQMIERSAPLPDQIYQRLRDSIVSLQLPPRMVLIEKEITEYFEVSRTPIREALRQLAEERLVTIRPQSGTFVAPISLADVRESMFIRMSLEVSAIRKAAANMDDAILDALDSRLAAMERAGSRRQSLTYIAEDDTFHRLIISATGYPRLWRLLASSKAQLDRLRHLRIQTLRENARRSTTVVDKEHRAIYDALRSGDPEACGQVMETHLDLCFQDLLRRMKDHPDVTA